MSAWLAVFQYPDGTQETEVVTFPAFGYFTNDMLEGSVIDTTAGIRITLIRPAEEAA